MEHEPFCFEVEVAVRDYECVPVPLGFRSRHCQCCRNPRAVALFPHPTACRLDQYGVVNNAIYCQYIQHGAPSATP